LTRNIDNKAPYHQLRDHLTADGKYRIPWRKEVLQILELRFTPEETEVALRMPVLGQSRVNLTELAKNTGKSEKRLQVMLDGMSRKGLVLAQTGRSGSEVYCLWDFLYSLYSPLYGDGYDDDNKRRIVELREKLWQAGYHFIWFSSRYPFNRVLPHEEVINNTERVEPWERASYYVAQVDSICVVACGCRASTKRCTKPLWTCLYFDREAEYWVKYRGGRYISKEECLGLLASTAKAGLVITLPNSQETPRVICNCCRDCCLILRNYTENHNPYALAKSNFTPHFDTEICKVCLTCLNSCPVTAIGRVPAHQRGKRDRMIVIEEHCIGCGVCATVCPNNAITLRKQRDVIPLLTLRETFSQLAQEALW